VTTVALSGGRPLRIGFLSWRDLAHEQAGGSEVLMDRLARGCLERGHEVALMCGGPVAERPYEVADLGGQYGQYLRAPFTHARRFRHLDVLVDVENGVPFFAPLWRRAPTVLFVHHVHGPQWRQRFPRPVADVGWALERRAMPAVYRRLLHLTVSPSTAEALAAIGVRRDQVRVLPMGVEVPAERSADRADEPLFLGFGRLVPHKRFDLLLRAWERVRPRTGGRLVIAGDGPERAALEPLAGEGVEFLGGVSEPEKHRLMQQAWLLLHPAMHEGWGMVIGEAAAAGTPTLAFDVPGVRDAVRHDRTGVLVRDEDAFVAAWERLAADGAERERLGREARAVARGATWERTVDAFLEALQAAIAGAPERGRPWRAAA
jgi:glycosyltransferase involved in cell wall biosynthesis